MADDLIVTGVFLAILVAIAAFAVGPATTALDSDEQTSIEIAEGETAKVVDGLEATNENIKQDNLTLELRDTDTGEQETQDLQANTSTSYDIRNQSIGVSVREVDSGNNTALFTFAVPRYYGWQDSAIPFADVLDVVMIIAVIVPLMAAIAILVSKV